MYAWHMMEGHGVNIKGIEVILEMVKQDLDEKDSEP